MANVLTGDQLEQFNEDGYTILKGAFPRPVAEAIHQRVVQNTGADPHAPATWTRRVIHLQQCYDGEPFASAFTPRLDAAFDELLGAGRWVLPRALGWWPVVFPGFDKGAWREPESGWHIDGSQFHHHLDSPDQVLLPIFLFNDMGPGDGGTCISPGSHKTAARVLRDAEPQGLTANELAGKVAAAPRDRVLEVQGEAGDVALMHPFMLHTTGINVGKTIRVICNPCVRFKERMNITGDPARPCSVVERSIAQAVGLKAGCH